MSIYSVCFAEYCRCSSNSNIVICVWELTNCHQVSHPASAPGTPSWSSERLHFHSHFLIHRENPPHRWRWWRAYAGEPDQTDSSPVWKTKYIIQRVLHLMQSVSKESKDWTSLLTLAEPLRHEIRWRHREEGGVIGLGGDSFGQIRLPCAGRPKQENAPPRGALACITMYTQIVFKIIIKTASWIIKRISLKIT